MNNLIHWLINKLTRRSEAHVAPPQQLDLGLDRVTESGLPLQDAMAVRSAEFWLALGEPRVALRELDTLTDLARQNDWSMRTHLRAFHTANSSAA